MTRGRPDHHDPTAGFGGAPPAYSALTLRIVLAAFGVCVCTAGAVAAALLDRPGWCVALAVLAAIAVVDLVIVIRRKRAGEPG
jgi:hypothetical protein